MTKTPAPKNSNNKKVVNRMPMALSPKPARLDRLVSQAGGPSEDWGFRQMTASNNAQIFLR